MSGRFIHLRIKIWFLLGYATEDEFFAHDRYTFLGQILEFTFVYLSDDAYQVLSWLAHVDLVDELAARGFDDIFQIIVRWRCVLRAEESTVLKHRSLLGQTHTLAKLKAIACFRRRIFEIILVVRDVTVLLDHRVDPCGRQNVSTTRKTHEELLRTANAVDHEGVDFTRLVHDLET